MHREIYNYLMSNLVFFCIENKKLNTEKERECRIKMNAIKRNYHPDHILTTDET